MRFHGNYCGPYWSAGQHQPSVLSNVPSLDEFDETCKQHDAAYATNGDLAQADFKFARENIGMGAKRTAAGLAVGFQGILRSMTTTRQNNKNENNNNKDKNMVKKTLRGAAQPKAAKTLIQKSSSRNDTVSAAPVAYSTKRTGTAAKMQPIKDGVIITHRSLLGQVVNNLPYTVTSYPINVGMSETFPWLSRLARRYEKYVVRKLRFEYRSVCSTSTSGVIMMSFDRDAADPAPVTKVDQAQTIPNSEANAWMNNDLVIPVDAIERFCRFGDLADNLDIKTYDMGTLFVSSLYGSNAVGGELYVEYTVELRYPTLGPEVGQEIRAADIVNDNPFSKLLGDYTSTAGLYNRGTIKPVTIPSSKRIQFNTSGEYYIILKANPGAAGTTVVPTPQTPTIEDNTGAVSSTGKLEVLASIDGGAAGTVRSGFKMLKYRAVAGERLVFLRFVAAATSTDIYADIQIQIFQAPYDVYNTI